MTFLSDTRIESPVTKTLRYHGGEGIFTYWDPEQKEEFIFALDRFIPLAGRSMITGYCKQAPKGKGNIWSNEVENMNEVLNVSIGGNCVFSGKWKDIKLEVKAKGGGFTPVCYADWDGEIVRILFSGAARGPWFDLVKIAHRTEGKPGVVITGFGDGEGSIPYKFPIFRLNEVLPETLERAIELKTELDQFFVDYAKAKGEVESDGMNQETEADEHYQADPEEVNAELQEIAATESTEKNHQAYQDVDGDEVPF